MSVMVETSVGEMVIDLFTDLCPLTTKNFLKLCKIKYFNNVLFHDVQKNFIVQTGDPTGTGKGGDSIYKFLYGDQARYFDDEIRPELKHSKVGTVAMASAGENCNASQFYITTRADLDHLDEKHTVFGQIAEGLETLMRINEAYVDEKGRPYKNIRIKHTYVLDDPFDDPVGLAELIPDHSPDLKREELDDVRLDEDWEPEEDTRPAEEVEKALREREAQGRAVVLEMVGDLPEAEVKPPENVLFVCKLNPVTQEDDLEIIFSRFGKILACDIIRDYKTGNSLCYAFIEFENDEACEAAYFKMDNVLVDDRRIHVDFSQSVSKLWNRFRKVGSKDTQQGNGQPNGRGCFNCGQEGHMAKNCPNEKVDPEAPRPRVELKDRGGTRGGAGRYDILVDEEEVHEPLPAEKERHRQKSSPQPNSRSRRPDADKDRHRSVRERSGDKSRDHIKRDRSRSRERHKSERERGRHSRDERDERRARSRSRERFRSEGGRERHRSPAKDKGRREYDERRDHDRRGRDSRHGRN